MEALMRENSKTVAIGNMKVNARGDQLGRNGEITKTADQIAREKHRVQSAIVHTGLKGKQPQVENVSIDPPAKPAPAKAEKKTKEVELPSGDIVIEEDKGQ
jgi:hypothetical protein